MATCYSLKCHSKWRSKVTEKVQPKWNLIGLFSISFTIQYQLECICDLHLAIVSYLRGHISDWIRFFVRQKYPIILAFAWWARLTVIRSENMSNVRPLFQVAYVHAHVYACSSLELLISTIMFNQQFLGKNYLNFRLIVITHDALD